MFLSVRRLAALTSVCLFTGTALAPAAPAADHHAGALGATPPEIVPRYGPVLAHNARFHHRLVITGGSAMDGDLHGKDGLVVRVVYHQNRAVLLEFTRAVGVLAPADVDPMLSSSGDDSTWDGQGQHGSDEILPSGR